ncbi:hypothetical protein EDC01DRAFT_431363 [Geopyxis carbonaria]|nr:hypothetical protein EDC01DRAFT_431363 [Geopyxis carbonaria]
MRCFFFYFPPWPAARCLGTNGNIRRFSDRPAVIPIASVIPPSPSPSTAVPASTRQCSMHNVATAWMIAHDGGAPAPEVELPHSSTSSYVFSGGRSSEQFWRPSTENSTRYVSVLDRGLPGISRPPQLEKGLIGWAVGCVISVSGNWRLGLRPRQSSLRLIRRRPSLVFSGPPPSPPQFEKKSLHISGAPGLRGATREGGVIIYVYGDLDDDDVPTPRPPFHSLPSTVYVRRSIN